MPFLKETIERQTKAIIYNRVYIKNDFIKVNYIYTLHYAIQNIDHTI